MNLNRLLAALAAAALCVCAMATPAMKGRYVYTQPDGTSFTVLLDGDEYNRIITTTDGCYVCRGSDGFYHYARFEADGRMLPSGYRVGAQAPLAVKAASKARPGALLARRAALRRAERASLTPVAPARRAFEVTHHKVFVLLAQFADLKFSYTREDFIALLSQQGYSVNGASGSVTDYFTAQFHGLADFEFVVSPIVTLSKEFAYYGENDTDTKDKNARDIVSEGCDLCADEVDFSQFDEDNDGQVDIVFAIVAGGDEAQGASTDHIWSHQWVLSKPYGNFNGKKVYKYAMSAELYSTSTELMRIGPFCHEYSHVLGLMDLYDTDYEKSGGQVNALGQNLSLMNAGCYNNGSKTPPNFISVELECLGLGHSQGLTLGDHTIQPIRVNGDYYKFVSDDADEYFLIEARDNVQWDKYINGKGLVVYHVDKTETPAGFSTTWQTTLTARQRWSWNEINCNPEHPCVAAVPSRIPEETYLSTDFFFPSGTITDIKAAKNSAYNFWQGDVSMFDITSIKINASDGSVFFSVAGPLQIGKVDVFQDAAIASWTSTTPGLTCNVVLASSADTVSFELKPYSGGDYSYTFEGLKPKTDYKLTVSVPAEGGNIAVSNSFRTRAYYTDLYPFIYLGGVARNEDNTIVRGEKLPLRVYNAKNAVEVEWTLTGHPISTGEDGYWVARSGQLKAVIKYSDGSVDVVSKKLIVR